MLNRCQWLLERSSLSSVSVEGLDPLAYITSMTPPGISVGALSSQAIPRHMVEEAYSLFPVGTYAKAVWADPYTSEGSSQIEVKEVSVQIQGTSIDFYRNSLGEFFMVATHSVETIVGPDSIVQVYRYGCTKTSLLMQALLIGSFGVAAFFAGRWMR